MAFSRRRVAFAVAGLATFALSSFGFAQLDDCRGTWQGDGLPGVDRSPAFVFEWNHDGDPQTPTWLVVGGPYTSTAGTVNVRDWAIWDGTAWRSLLGLIPAPLRFAYSGDVIDQPFAADPQTGELWQFQRFRLLRRDPLSGEWTSLSANGNFTLISQSNDFAASQPASFIIHQGVPHFIGNSAGLQRYLFRWTGSQFVPVAPLPPLSQLKLYSFGQDIYLSSNQASMPTFPTRVWKLESDAFQPLTSGVPTLGAVNELVWFQGSVHAVASGYNSTPPECFAWVRLHRWTGSEWQRLEGTCVSGTAATVLPDGGLYFTSLSPQGASLLTRWDGTTQTVLDVSLTGAFTKFRDGIANWRPGSSFFQPSRPEPLGGLGINIWNAGNVLTLGTGFNAPITDILADDQGVVVAGSFTQAGSSLTGPLASADGDSWAALPPLPSTTFPSPRVQQVTRWQGNIIVAQRRHIRMLLGNSWQDLGPETSLETSGLVVFRGDLYRSLGTQLEKWNGQSWLTVATVAASQPNWVVGIASIKVLADRIAILGSFDSINGQPIQGVALWSPESLSGLFAETLVDPLGGPDWIRDIELFRGSHYAAGYSGVYRLDGSQWVPITSAYDTGVRSTGPMLAFADRLFVAVAPWLQTSRGLASYLVEFDGQAWRPSIGYSVARDDQTITSLSHHEGQLLVGGSFTTLIDVNRSVLDEPDIAFFARYTPVPHCDPIDFNNDGTSFDPTDIDAFLSVFSEGPCIPAGATCNDIDFNNDCSLYDPEDIDAFMRVFSEGTCLP